RSIEAPGGMAASVHDNDAAVAMDGAQFGEHLLARALGAFMPQLHARADIARDADADEIFPGAGGGNATNAVLGVSAGADDWRISHAAPEFCSGASGGGAGRDIAVLVHGDDADSAELVVVRKIDGALWGGRGAGGPRRDRQVAGAQLLLQ